MAEQNVQKVVMPSMNIVVAIILLVAGILSASVATAEQTKCIVGDVNVNVDVPTIIEGCTSADNSPIGSSNGTWLTATSCPPGLVGMKGRQGDAVYTASGFPGVFVICVSPQEALTRYTNLVVMSQRAMNVLMAYLPQGPYNDAWCQAKTYDYSVDPNLGYCACFSGKTWNGSSCANK